jgi:hypothetical protein
MQAYRKLTTYAGGDNRSPQAQAAAGEEAIPRQPAGDFTFDGLSNQSGQSTGETYDSEWSLTGDGDTLKKRREPFNRLARRAVVALGQKFTNRDEAVDAWLNILHRFHWERKTPYARAYWRVRQVSEASAECCAELSTRFHEDGNADSERKFVDLERRFRESSDQTEGFSAIRRRETRLRRDRYPFGDGLYDHPHESLSDPLMELGYWKAHVWKGYHFEVGHWERLDRRGSAWAGRREKLTCATVGLSYDLAVLQANYAIHRGLRGDEATQVFEDETVNLLGQVTEAWRAGCARLALSGDHDAEEIEILTQAFHRVRDDLRRLLDHAGWSTSARRARRIVSGSSTARATTRWIIISTDGRKHANAPVCLSYCSTTCAGARCAT